MGQRRSVFTETQRERLARLGEQVHSLDVERRLLSECSSDLLGLPAYLVGRAEGELRELARMGWSGFARPTDSLRRFFARGPKTHQEQLAATPGLEAFYAFNSDGYLRQAALDRMTGPCRSPFEAAIILYRLNDWVRQVRSAAFRCAERRLSSTPVSYLAAAWVGLADRMHLWTRGSEEQLTVLADLIARQDVRDWVAAWVAQSREGPVTAILDQILRQPLFDAYLHRLATSAWRPQVRARALGCLLDGEARWVRGYRREWIDKAYGGQRRVADIASRSVTVSIDRGALMREMAADRSPLVRRTVATALVSHRHALPNWREIAERLQDDRNPSIRQRAEWVIAEMEKSPA